MRSGRRLGVDVGAARVGVAVSDTDGILATPVETVRRDDAAAPGADLDRVAELAREHEVIEVVVGLPIGMDGTEGAAAAAVRAYAVQLAARLRPIAVRLLDERLSTVSAHRFLREAGRATKGHRAVVDQQAAVTILQVALDLERSQGKPPGEPLQSRKPRAQRPRT